MNFTAVNPLYQHYKGTVYELLEDRAGLVTLKPLASAEVSEVSKAEFLGEVSLPGLCIPRYRKLGPVL